MYFKEEDVIKSTILLSPDSIDSEFPSFNIAYGIDKNFLFGCAISITSILTNNSDKKFTFHVFTDVFEKDDELKFLELAQQYNTKIVIYIIDCEKLKSLPSTKNWTYATYFRFIIADYFNGRADVVLYLDADIMCKGDLREIINLQLGDNIAGVVPERGREWWEKRAESLGFPSLVDGYFNAGFLLINIKKWAEFDISSQAMDMLTDKELMKRISFLDQDVLNIILTKKVLYLSVNYNTQFSINYELKKDCTNPITAETILVHYIGPTKPWHEWAQYPSAKYFSAAKKLSPWDTVPLIKPKSTNQLRYCAKHKFNQHRLIEGIYCYFKYFSKKMF